MYVKQGDVSNLRFPADTYDLATAFETIYFWPGLENCFAEVCRVLRTGGVFMIVNESDGTDETSLKYEKIIDGMKCYTIEQIESALKAAGFSSVTSDHFNGKPWITVIAVK
jgi:ubiquinone/menaquinone biosynthesis C-methylase UbiE